MIHKFNVCLDCWHTQWRWWYSTCKTIEITLLEIIHKDNVWKNLGREFFVLRIVKFDHSMNMIYWTDTIYGRIFYKNQSFKEDSYIHKIPSPHGIYISLLYSLTTIQISPYHWKIWLIPCSQALISIKEIEMDFSSHSKYIKICSHNLTYELSILIISLDLAEAVSSYRPTTYQIQLFCMCACFD